MDKHLISLDGVSPQGFADLLAVAVYLKRRRAAGVAEHALAGRTLAMIFEKPSLRTRLSFEVGVHELGGHALHLRGEEVGLGVREPVRDAARVLSRMVHGIMLRTFKHETLLELAKHATVPVINGLCDLFHPCQALADVLTIKEHLGTTAKLKVAFIGDANNVCRSLARACILGGSELVLACPQGYGFDAAFRAGLGADAARVTEVRDPAEAARGAHVLYTDVWTSMGQEAETSDRAKAFAGYRIDGKLIAAARPDCLVMHDLPAHRGEEITDEAVEHPRSVIFDQAENRLHAQKAVMRLLMAPDRDRVVAAARAES
ncbi:MAG TPA: ornithine carbamoyltransferase [Planctomycetota bacterium]|nr:ornithine carbamoyltransferase [Planctomycetota bacterium]